MDAELKQLVVELFGSVEVGPFRPQYLEHPYRVVGISRSQSLIFREKATLLLRRISKRLAYPALSGRGLSIEGAENLVTQACKQSLELGQSSALRWLEAEVEKPELTWLVFQPARIRFTGDDLKIGSSHLYKNVPESYADEVFITSFAPEFKGPVIAASPTAKDEHSARRLAHEYFEEARAIALFADGLYHAADASTPHLIGYPGKLLTADAGKSDWLDLGHVQDKDGRLYPEYAALSAGAAKREQERTDWERRVLAATRWNAIAVTSAWPSQALGTAMIALECLFVRGRKQQRKGEAIASSVAARWKGRSDQEEWLKKLYSSRNAVTHEGRYFQEEADVYDLLSILAQAVHWGAWHLHDMHRSDEKICATFDDVMAPHE